MADDRARCRPTLSADDPARCRSTLSADGPARAVGRVGVEKMYSGVALRPHVSQRRC